MFNFWQTKNLINEIDCEWVFASFREAITYFDPQEFYQRTKLIQPTDAFFPGKINDPSSMANTVFNATLQHCGLQHWPFQLQHIPSQGNQHSPLLEKSEHFMKRNSTHKLSPLTNTTSINIYYNLHQTTQPGDLAASFSHVLAQHLFYQSQLQPIGGNELFEQNTEILAIIMGFGVMLSNSAYAYRGGCSRCFNPQAHRQASLSEDKVIFALALFCQLKKIPYQQATKHLKPYLRNLYKQAIKQIKQSPKRMATLMNINALNYTNSTN
jgi:hypothetical protein